MPADRDEHPRSLSIYKGRICQDETCGPVVYVVRIQSFPESAITSQVSLCLHFQNPEYVLPFVNIMYKDRGYVLPWGPEGPKLLAWLNASMLLKGSCWRELHHSFNTNINNFANIHDSHFAHSFGNCTGKLPDTAYWKGFITCVYNSSDKRMGITSKCSIKVTIIKIILSILPNILYNFPIHGYNFFGCLLVLVSYIQYIQYVHRRNGANCPFPAKTYCQYSSDPS